MRKNKRLTTVASALSVVLLLTAAKAGDGVITKENGMTVINTTELTHDVKGYQSPTPVKIFIKQNKVVRVEALPNQETPKFFDRAKAILTFWDGKAVSQAVKEAPDAVTGATLSVRGTEEKRPGRARALQQAAAEKETEVTAAHPPAGMATICTKRIRPAAHPLFCVTGFTTLPPGWWPRAYGRDRRPR